MNFEELEKLVIEWGENKGIVPKSTPLIQFSKTMEEMAELVDGLARRDIPEIKDAYGDVLVTLIIGHHLAFPNQSIVEQLEAAYDIISKRTGKEVNGKFIKDE